MGLATFQTVNGASSWLRSFAASSRQLRVGGFCGGNSGAGCQISQIVGHRVWLVGYRARWYVCRIGSVVSTHFWPRSRGPAWSFAHDQHHKGIAGLGFLVTNFGSAAETGIIAKSSNYSAPETIQRFESAVKAKVANGWIVFTEIDHAAAAQKAGLDLKPRTVVVFGNPKLGTTPMQKAATLAIDVLLKALIWEDEQGKVLA
jgi:uncharacterized protein (DUF302 family)